MAPKVQERKSNVRIKKSHDQEGSATGIGTVLALIFGKSLYRQIATVIVIISGVVGFLAYRSTPPSMKKLVNADPEVLKDAFFSDTPHLFYCDKGTGSAPAVFSELHVIKGNSINFATVNCSQVLPSGKTLWDRFKLKKDWKPTIFGTAPWTKAVQIHPTHLANAKAFKKSVEDSLSPKATVVKSDQHLAQHCQFSKNVVYDDRDITPTCILLIKGTKFTSTTSQLEQRLVQAYPKVKFAVTDASKYRMTFEDPDGMPADYFALKVHALRNGTHYQSMVHPITWDYLNTFVSSAASAPLYDYQGEADRTVHLMKLKDLRAKKERDAKRRASKEASKGSKKASSNADEEEPVKEDTKRKAQKATSTDRQKKGASKPKTESKPTEEKLKKDAESATDSTSDPVQPESSTVSDDASLSAEQLQRERERQRREEMERQQREYLFESNDDAEDTEVTGSDEELVEEDEDDSIIEL